MTGFQKMLLTASVVLMGVLIYFISPILTPFLLGALLAYLGNPLVNRLVKYHLSRTLAVIVVFVFILSLVTLLLVTLIPLLEDQIILLINKVPIFFSWIQTIVIPWIESKFGINISGIDLSSIASMVTADWQQTGHVATSVVQTVGHSSAILFAVLLNLVLIPVVTFYLLRDWLLVTKKTKNLIPRKYLKSMTEIFSECNEVLGAFFRGQLLVMLGLGVFYSVALGIAGLDLAFLLGVLIAFLSIVPYLGTIVGLAIGIIAVLFQFADITHIIYIIMIFVVGHILESFVLSPLLIGDRIGLHPVAVIFAILAGGELFGFFGILLALPIAAVIMVWVRYIYNHYRNSKFYQT